MKSEQKDAQSVIKDLAYKTTWLFVPATKMPLVTKAFNSGADCVIVDLEDTVTPADKPQARLDLQDYHDSRDYQPVWVRINRACSAEFIEDIQLCERLPKLAGVLLAKAERAEDIEHIYQATGLPVIAQIESVIGLYHIDAMAKATGIVAFSYGFLDLCNDLQVQVDTPAADIVANQIRYQLILTSKMHNLLAPIDSVYPDFKDSEALEQRVQLWSQMGMTGILCIHPKQVTTVKAALRPSDSEIDFAKRVVAEYEGSGAAVFKIDDNMIDAPVIERCLRLLRDNSDL